VLLSHGPLANNRRRRGRLAAVARRDARQSTQRQVSFLEFFFLL